jgi:hypothetical protein
LTGSLGLINPAENLGRHKDLTGQLRDKGTELANAKGETDHLAIVLEKYQTQHIRSAVTTCWSF